MEIDVNKLKRLRKKRVMSIEDLSAESGVHRNTISRIENGRSEAHTSTIRKLAQALRVDPSELVIID
jgi:transcriptional regulator with XRE-family HTH domain